MVQYKHSQSLNKFSKIIFSREETCPLKHIVTEWSLKGSDDGAL
jgi:hypothetical protein